MTRLLRTLLLALAFFCACSQRPAPAAEPPLRLGVMPFAPAEDVLEQFGHVQRYLQSALGRPVTIASARDYGDFARHLLNDAYDLAYTAPHLGLLGVRHGRWRPLVRTSQQVRPILVVRRDGGIASLQDLRGKVLATPDPLALVTLIAEEELAKAGLRPGVAITVAHTPSHQSAMMLAVRRLADGAVSIPILLERMPPAMREQLTVLETFPERFALAYLASARLDADLQQQLQTLLLAFPDSPQGQSFFGVGPRLQYFPLDENGLQIYASMLPTLLKRIPQTSAK